MGNHRYEDYDDDDMLFEDDSEAVREYTLEDALQALPQTGDGLVPYEVVMGLSDLEITDLNRVRPEWRKLSDEQRLNIMERLAEVTEVDYEMDYSTVARLGYEDSYAPVRVAAINASYGDDSLDNLDSLMPIASKDSSAEVRAAAISRIGQYIYLGEVEEIDPAETVAAQELALKLHNDPNEALDVRCRALEAISHASREGITELIQAAYDHDDLRMRTSAINAMGNTCDPRWEKNILQEMESDQNEMRFEAIRAAGSLSLKQAVNRLADFGYDDDPQIQEAVVWALGEIGGDEALSTLEKLYEYAESNQDEELLDSIEEAMDMAQFMASDDLEFGFLDVEEYDDDDYDYDEDED